MAEVQPALRNSNTTLIAHAIYGIFAFSAISAATVVGLLVSLIGFVGIILAHVYINDARGTWLESHYTWLIRTFWWSAVWNVIAWVFAVTLVGIPISLAIWGISFLWVAYRLIRGWINLFRDQPV